MKNETFIAFQIKKEALKHHIEQIWIWDEAEQFQFHLDETPTIKEEFLYSDDTRIGYLQTQEDENCLFIWGIYLLNAYQSSGYGNELFKQLIIEAERNGKIIELEVFKINTKAIRFYERLGFVKISENEYHFRYLKS